MITQKRFYEKFLSLRRKLRSQQQTISEIESDIVHASEVQVDPIDNMDATDGQNALQELQIDIDMLTDGLLEINKFNISPLLLMGS